jgi:K+-transporting ATPase A subunit
MDPVTEFLVQIRGIVNMLIPLAVACALLFFIWGLVVYIVRSGDIKSKEEGRTRMIWGVIALFIIVSIWGIVGFLGGLLGIGQGGLGAVPGIENPL